MVCIKLGSSLEFKQETLQIFLFKNSHLHYDENHTAEVDCCLQRGNCLLEGGDIAIIQIKIIQKRQDNCLPLTRLSTLIYVIFPLLKRYIIVDQIIFQVTCECVSPSNELSFTFRSRSPFWKKSLSVNFISLGKFLISVDKTKYSLRTQTLFQNRANWISSGDRDDTAFSVKLIFQRLNLTFLQGLRKFSSRNLQIGFCASHTCHLA